MSETSRTVIAIDAMGGDNAPRSVLKGISRFADSGVHFLIYGDEGKLSPMLNLIGNGVSYEIRHTDVTVTADMDVMTALRSGKNSGMGLAIKSVKDGEAAAVVSAGNTGMYMALAKIILQTISGIDRPAIASVLPGKDGDTVCLDLGANAECTVKNLADFAIMGESLARSVFAKEDVSIALLNIGSEKGKGNRLVKQTSHLLEKLFDNYVGFVEGDDISSGKVDVIVTDGFTGNVFLKTMEGTAKYISSLLKGALTDSFLSRVGSLLALPSLLRLKKKVDPRLYNGAILVGLNGVVVKSHGGTDEVGFASAVEFTLKILRNNIFERINLQLEKSQALHQSGEFRSEESSDAKDRQ